MGKSTKKLKISKEIKQAHTEVLQYMKNDISVQRSSDLFYMDKTAGTTFTDTTLSLVERTKLRREALATAREKKKQERAEIAEKLAKQVRSEASRLKAPSNKPIKGVNKASVNEELSKISQEKRKQDKQKSTELMDLWSDDKPNQLYRPGIDIPVNEQGWAAGPRLQSKFIHRGLSKTMPATANQPIVKSIHGGTSYRPLPEEHSELLQKAIDFDAKQRKEQQELAFRLRGGDSAYEPVTGKNLMEEDEEEDAADGETPVNSRIVVENRKTKTQRNREAANKEKEKEQQNKTELKKLGKQIDRIPALLAEIKKEQKVQKKRKLETDQKKTQPNKPLKFGKYALEESIPDVQIPEDISSNLRELVPSIELMRDQYKRFQQRGLIEARKKFKTKRRYALKVFERYKENRESNLMQ